MYARASSKSFFSDFFFSIFDSGGITKHLSSFGKQCFQPTLLRVSGKQNSLFPLWPVIKCLMCSPAICLCLQLSLCFQQYLVWVFIEVKVLVKMCYKLAVQEVVTSIYCPKAPVRVIGSVGTETKFSP